MTDIDMALVTEFVNQNIDSFHQNRVKKIQELKLKDVLKRKNPYLFRAKNIISANDLVTILLDGHISSSEETTFGKFLESLAIYVCGLTYGGQKSSAGGIDLEFTLDKTRYIVTIKSSPNWGNNDQYQSLEENFKRASKILRQSSQVTFVQPVLGMCYGKKKDVDTGTYLKKHGQSFWTFISGNSTLYIDIVEPLGYMAEERNSRYEEEKITTVNRFVGEFVPEFCHPNGQIDWAKLVEFNSGNIKGEE